MIKYNLILAARNLKKRLGYTTINLVGLSFAICFSLLIFSWVTDERSVDQFHEEKSLMYKLMSTNEDGSAGLVTSDIMPYPLVDILREEFPEISHSIGFHFTHKRTLYKDNIKSSASGSFANFSLFDTFTFPLVEGTTLNADENLEGIFISERLAEEYFGAGWRGNVLGQTIRIEGSFEETPFDYKVVGVFENVPENSTLKFDFITNIRLLVKNHDWINQIQSSQIRVFIQVRPGTDLSALGRNITALLHEKYEVDNDKYFLHSFSDNYLHGNFEDGVAAGGRIEYVRIFSIAGFFLLLIACINFINLSTAESATRIKGLSVRKIVGADRTDLMWQYLTETGLLVAISTCIGLVLSYLLLPYVELWTNKSLGLPLQSMYFWFIIILMVLLLALLSGWYPAFQLSRQKIDIPFGDSFVPGTGVGLRKALVVFQFAIAMILLSSALVVKDQIAFIMQRDLGYDISRIVSIPASQTTSKKFEIYKNELANQIGITGVTSTSHGVLVAGSSTTGVSWPGKDPTVENEISLMWTDPNFAEVFDLQVLEGKYHMKPRTDSLENIVMNETAARLIGLKDPVGKTIMLWDEPATIVGVVKDFQNQKIQSQTLPMFLLLEETFMSYFHIRTAPGMTETAIEGIQKVNREIAPGEPIAYSFLDEEYESLYNSEILTGKIADNFSLMALVISCLGLLGLATLLARQKKREIGIRKILGASVSKVVANLSSQFLVLVLLGLMLSIPISWYFLESWLSGFAYGVHYNLRHLILPGLLMVSISLFTVVIRGWNAARANPVDALRTE